MIAVVGATGNTGRAVVRELVQLGHRPICLVRNAEKAAAILGPQVTVKVAELSDRNGLLTALAGAERLFVVTGHSPQMVEQQNNILDAAIAVGATYLVRVSGGAAVVQQNSASVVGRGHFTIEQRLHASDIGWVILRPGLFMQNVLSQAAAIKNESKFSLPFPSDLPLALTDVGDTGAIAARILANPAPHRNRTYHYTGAKTTYRQLAEDFSDVLGRKIIYVSLEIEEAVRAMKARGMPDWLVVHLTTIAKLGADGALSIENTGPILEFLDRVPLTTKAFVRNHKDQFV
jgi:NAD(P)H dehydrogenase (quinone)